MLQNYVSYLFLITKWAKFKKKKKRRIYQLMTFETTPAPTVRPPSLSANLCPVKPDINIYITRKLKFFYKSIVCKIQKRLRSRLCMSINRIA
ncbi:hypothetical protein HanIR_Chr11g0536121 [Helianthus annuus]|nr:hypothetical protein HanIR_Chr11g0536121 [Helianthus annuus]